MSHAQVATATTATALCALGEVGAPGGERVVMTEKSDSRKNGEQGMQHSSIAVDRNKASVGVRTKKRQNRP